MAKMIKNVALGIIVLAVAIVTMIYTRYQMLRHKTYAKSVVAISDDVAKADLRLGERIYAVRAGCIDCHGGDLAGREFINDGAMGVFHGANITPAFLKDWSDDDIAIAIRQGIHKDGRSLNGMPSMDYVGLSRGDLAALIKYIRSVPENATPTPAQKFGPVGATLGAFGKLPLAFPAEFLQGEIPFSDKPAEAPTVEFGRYLAQSCTGCHGADFKGGPIPGGDPNWPPALSLRLGDKPQWSESSFKRTLADGVSPTTGQPMRLPMPVELLKQFNDTEVQALWAFFSTLKD